MAQRVWGCSLRLLQEGSNPISQIRSERWTKFISVGCITAEDVHSVRRLRTAVPSYEEEILGERTKLDTLQLLDIADQAKAKPPMSLVNQP